MPKKSKDSKSATSKSTKATPAAKNQGLWYNRNNRIWMILVVLVFVVAGYFLLFSHAATPAAPNVYLTSTSTTMAANTTFTVQVRENSGSTAVNAVQANFSYPTSLVSFVSIDSTNTAFPTGDTLSSGATAGSVSLVGGTSTSSGTATPVTGDQLIATITFKTLTTTGTANMAFTSGTVLVNSSTNTDILGSLSNTTGTSFTVDNTVPTAGLTTPTNGATVSNGSNVTITATASDNVSVASVGIYIDGTLKTTLTSSPYTYSWSTSGVSLGAHTIQAKATDGVGNVGSSSTISVTVADQTAPTVSITAPSGGTTQKGTVTVNVNSSDNTGGAGVAKVEFYVDGALNATDTTTPYTFSWNSTTATDGTHTLTAKAYDGATPANVATSSAISVTVDNNPPTQPGNLQASGITLTNVSLSWTASTDTIGVTGYRVQRNGTTITTTNGTTLSYNDSGLASGTSYTYTVAALDAAGNVSSAATLTTSTIASVPGDANADGHVNLSDLSILLANYNTTNSSCDFNRDGIVNIFDLSILLSHYGT